MPLETSVSEELQKIFSEKRLKTTAEKTAYLILELQKAGEWPSMINNDLSRLDENKLNALYSAAVVCYERARNYYTRPMPELKKSA